MGQTVVDSRLFGATRCRKFRLEFGSIRLIQADGGSCANDRNGRILLKPPGRTMTSPSNRSASSRSWQPLVACKLLLKMCNGLGLLSASVRAERECAITGLNVHGGGMSRLLLARHLNTRGVCQGTLLTILLLAVYSHA
jgi:hypothetical protein